MCVITFAADIGTGTCCTQPTVNACILQARAASNQTGFAEKAVSQKLRVSLAAPCNSSACIRSKRTQYICLCWTLVCTVAPDTTLQSGKVVLSFSAVGWLVDSCKLEEAARSSVIGRGRSFVQERASAHSSAARQSAPGINSHSFETMIGCQMSSHTQGVRDET